MKRAKVEIHLDILRALTQNGPLKLTHLMLKSRLNCKVLNTSLDYLINQGLVEKRTIIQRRKKITAVWAITNHGATILKYYQELTQALPLMEKAIQKPRTICRQFATMSEIAPITEKRDHKTLAFPLRITAVYKN